MPNYGAQQYGQYANPVATEAPIMAPSFGIWVDWDGAGAFGNAYTNITTNVFDVQCSRGRDYASQLTGRAVAGKAQITLDNRDGKYSSFNSSSPVYGKILPNRKVDIYSSSPYTTTLWTGFLDRIEPVAGGRPMATLYASGAFLQLGSQANLVSALPQSRVTTDVALHALLDAANWPVGQRIIETGSVELGNWYKEQAVCLPAAQELEDTEQGFLFEGLDWDVVFHARYHRILTAASLTSQATFSDAPVATYHYADVVQSDPLREIYNELSATIQPYATAVDLAVLWTLQNEQLTIPPGGSVTFTAKYSRGYAFPWTTPVVGTDLVLAAGLAVNADISVTVVKSAQSMQITVANSGAFIANFGTTQARGIAITPLNPYQVKAADATSQALYGKRSFPLPSPWYPSAYAQAACDFFVLNKKNPHPIVTLTLHSGTDPDLFVQAVSRVIGDRITVVATGLLTELGISGDFFIEGIAHRFGARTPMETTWILSPAESATHYWILGDPTDGVLGSTTKLAY